MSESRTPTYIYKLVSFTSPIPDPVPETLPLSELDAADGFMHFSTSRQIPRTLKRFFAQDPRVTILRIDYSKVEHEIRWEDSKGTAPREVGGEGIFPHIYNRALSKADIESMLVLESNNGDWDEALKKAERWMLY
ncbi:Uracil phosphoribosyltransferase [Mycena sanguinolenta]|uniref:Uracil phosphoribosyltransferase n=1 Tax=Mycena sanguinolenta TaxID=230812 RepID=A0A8H6Y6K9_9AGAR|nr:Uracil phosphoribosyltransferase [Mycena sanguinolenta]